MSVIVQERLPRRFGIGGSYSSLDGAGVEAYWVHRNLFGKAERLRFDAKVAGIGSDVGDGGTFDPDDLTYRVGVTFTKPGIYTPDTDFIASLFGDREVLDPYTEDRDHRAGRLQSPVFREALGTAFPQCEPGPFRR